MGEKVNFQDLIELLIARQGVGRDEADAFLRTFFALIEEGLDRDKYVKIKGLGTFKLVDVESRESINVNTGERIKIKGHTKVSFTPDTALRDVINKPFAHFETVVVRNEALLEMTVEEPYAADKDDENEQNSDQPSDEEGSKPLTSEPLIEQTEEDEYTEDAQVDESADFVSVVDASDTSPGNPYAADTGDENAQNPHLPENEEEIPLKISDSLIEQEEEHHSTEDVQPDDPDVFIPALDISGTLAETHLEETVAEESIEAPTEAAAKEEEEEKPVEESSDALRDTDEDCIKKEEHQDVENQQEEETGGKKSNVNTVLITIAVLTILLCGVVLFHAYFSDSFTGNNPPAVAEDELWNDNVLNDSIIKDSVFVASADSVREPELPLEKPEATPVAPVASAQASATSVPFSQIPVKADSTSYDIVGTSGTHKIDAGETLIRISYKYYGTKDLWPYILKHNRDVIKNSNILPVGETIRIPELKKKA